MNVILIGNNGAGKSTIANKLYKDGYHIVKEAPKGSTKDHETFAILCLVDYHLVFDRWNVIDRAIYENEYQHLQFLTPFVRMVNENNVIIYLTNNVTPYDNKEDESRSVQRPDYETKRKLDLEYEKFVNQLKQLGFDIHHVEVRPDVEETYNIIKSIIASKGETK
jgi:GTPase SAR1 family protein